MSSNGKVVEITDQNFADIVEGHVHAVGGQFFDHGTTVPGDGFEERRRISDGPDGNGDVIERISVHGQAAG